MNETNPIQLAEALRATLRRYIATTLPISRRYPRLAEQFRQVLAQEKLVDGPYVEALPDFEKGRSLQDLLIAQGGFLQDALGMVPHAQRRLHLHQQTALQLAVQEGKNLLVATGTGSGKTETFLYPIANALLSDPEPEKPGVRALLIYPMNALANDQLFYRIAPLFARYLADYGITFGRYTGQVRANANREEEEQKLLNNRKLMAALDYPDRIPRNWLLTREEMLASPPKLLITNYAMLEHLLLLPRNESLFSRQALRMLVLDEIHTYSGAQATEVAFLLRKLKNRLGISEQLQVFGTSASLAEGGDADVKLIEFGSQLFGEPIHRVIRGKRIVHERLRQSAQNIFGLSTNDWIEVGRVIDDLLRQPEEERTPHQWISRIEDLRVGIPRPEPTSGETLEAYLERVLAGSREIRKVAEVLDQQGVKPFADLALRVFDDPADVTTPEQRYQALSSVIRMGMVAREASDSFPLLPGRYHIAVNGIEGIAVRLGGNEEGWETLNVGRQFKDEQGIYYPMLVCRRCGQPYLEAFQEGPVLRNRRSDQDGVRAERKVFWLGQPPGEAVDDEEDDKGEDPASEYSKVRIDPRTGAIDPAAPGAVTLFGVLTEHEEEEKAWYVRKCPCCGGRASGADAEILTRMHPGNEALGSVTTQRVLEALPALEVDYIQPRPALGRTLLTFSDNRQDAAFFAPYFERTSGDLALRSAIHRVLRDRSQPIDARQLAKQIFKLWSEEGRQPIMLDQDGELRTDESDVTELIVGAIGAEFCTPSGRRNSLEALGLVKVTYDAVRLQQLVQRVTSHLPPKIAGEVKAIDALLHVLLETVRREKALGRFFGIDLRSEFVWGSSYSGHRSFELQSMDAQISNKWLPPEQGKRHNRRTWYLVEQLGLTRGEAFELLRQMWDLLKREPVALMRVVQPGFGLDGEAIRFASAQHSGKYVCRSCGLLQQHVVFGKCTAFGCHGEVHEMTAEERQQFAAHNHYLVSFDEPDHLTVRAREHTASLSTELRESIEREFAERQVNVLSCTTTMEMGVDLGDLEAVVNLNVPPGIANYQQRTGRAGRRAQAAPFCVTVAKNSQYDQSVFRDFRGYLGSSPGIPFVHLDNEELFWRHQESVLLSHFLRARIKDSTVNAPSLADLFGESFGADQLAIFREQFQAWMEDEPGKRALEEAERMRDRLPATYQHIARAGPYLRERFFNSLLEFAEEVKVRWSKYDEKVKHFASQNDHTKAAHWQRNAKKYMGQFLVTQMSRRGLIPTYSFPVHSLTLEVIREQGGKKFGFNDSEIELSRDASLGIAEYSPGAEVVANGRIWTSEGLAQYPKQFMPDRWYVACPECFHVDIGDTPNEVPPACSNCGSSEGRRKRKFVEPKGFVTAYARRKGRDPGGSRRRVKPADEARLIASPRNDQFEECGVPALRTALLRASGGAENALRGAMFIANRGVYGEGYLRCNLCNFTMAKPPQVKVDKVSTKGKAAGKAKGEFPHEDPLTGSRCPNTQLGTMGIDLVHRFDTDVRLYRFLEPLPPPPADESSPRNFSERVARTISEACRFAAAELLDIQSSAIRATYRLFGSGVGLLEVVLYDAVPGGAGYCAKLGAPQCDHHSLLQRVKRRLDCTAACANGCRQCLCDYANQRHWDSFERVAALEWIRGILGEGDHVVAPGNFQPWKTPSLSALEDRLANFDEINVLARRLVGNEAIDEPSLALLTRWLHTGKKVRILLTEELENKPKSAAALEAYRFLHPYAMRGDLTLASLAKEHRDHWVVLPRVFPNPMVDVPLFKQAFAHQAILSGLLAGNVEMGACDESLEDDLRNVISCACQLPVDCLKEGDRLELFELAEGEQRRISDIFGGISGCYVKQITVRDPFCGVKKHRGKLQRFLADLLKLPKTTESVEIHCREDKPGEHYEHRFHVMHHIEDMVAALGIANPSVLVQENSMPVRNFHDREVDIQVVNGDGTSLLHRYFLTGGIDYLLDSRSATKVFHYVSGGNEECPGSAYPLHT